MRTNEELQRELDIYKGQESVKVRKLEEELRVAECLKKEREVSNNIYALKIVEKIVFGLVGVVLLAVIGAVVALVIR